jgi:hypothetical protein
VGVHDGRNLVEHSRRHVEAGLNCGVSAGDARATRMWIAGRVARASVAAVAPAHPYNEINRCEMSPLWVCSENCQRSDYRAGRRRLPDPRALSFRPGRGAHTWTTEEELNQLIAGAGKGAEGGQLSRTRDRCGIVVISLPAGR